MAAITICSDFGAQKNKVSHCFHCFPIYFPWSDGTRCHDLSFLNVELKPTFSLSCFTFIKRLFSSPSLSAIRVVSSVYTQENQQFHNNFKISDAYSNYPNCSPNIYLYQCVWTRVLLKLTQFYFVLLLSLKKINLFILIGG